MKLSEFLQENGMTQTAFSEQIGCKPAVISRYVNGERIPEPEIMKNIHEITGGLVTANDFYGLTDTPTS